METENIKTFSGWDRAQHMRELHAQGRYKGVDTKIGLWNVSQERKDRMRKYYEQNHLDKTSQGFGSESHLRKRNRELLHNKFQGKTGYLYLLDFPGSIKVGFSKDWERRTTKQILGGKVLLIISGPTNELADFEYNILSDFKQYTKLNSDKTHYTEYLDKKIEKSVINYILSYVSDLDSLKIEINNLV